MMTDIYNLILYQPLFNILIFIYQHLPGKDFGVAVILLTLLIRLVLYPLMAKSIKSQKLLAELQPKIREIQQKFQSDKQAQAKEIMALYKKENISPFGGFLPLLIQLPILFALYQVFWKGVGDKGIDPTFLGILDLSQPSIILAVLSGIAQFFQTKLMTPARNASPSDAGGPKGQMDQFSNMFQKQMLYLFPLFTIFILFKLPSAIGIYWVVTSLFSIGQQYIVMRKHGDAK